MPIDPLSETTLSLSQAARRLPRLRAGRPVHPSTVWRWAMTGLRGIRLETAMIGGVRVTSEAALRRFFAEVGNASQLSGASSVSMMRSAAEACHDDYLERQLDAEGL